MNQSRNKPDAETLSREARFLKNRLLDSTLLEIFTGEREGTDEERKKLHAITKKRKKGIYTEAVFLLTHTFVSDSREAQRIFEDIIHHRNSLVRSLKRNVSVQVAALDYMQNVRNILKRPTIIEADQYEQFVYRAVVDETTQAFDKDLLEDDIDGEIEKSHRFGTIFSILFIDLDDLKTINDTYGHETGTRAIQAVSQGINENLRKYDSVYRYGGDEFIVLLPRSGSTEAFEIAKRIQMVINEKSFDTIPLKIGVSIGTATFDNLVISDRISLITAADSALYNAKKQGKNNVCRYGMETGTSSENIAGCVRNKNGIIRSKKRTLITGLPLVPGIGIGKLFVYHDILSREIETREIQPYEIDAEMERILRAVDKVKNDLEILRGTLEKDIGLQHASIFDVHRIILDDADLLNRIEIELKAGMLNGEHAVRNVFKHIERQFNGSTSNVVRDRSVDIRDIGKRVLKVLTGSDESVLSEIKDDTIIFAKRLLPSDTIHFTIKKPVAIITEEGGPNSHSALIARAMGIPSVSGVSLAENQFENGTSLLVNGDDGSVVFNPNKRDFIKYSARSHADRHIRNQIIHAVKKHAHASGKISVGVYANVSSADDIRAATEFGCDGIGLYRTESALMLYRKMPTKDELLTHFTSSLAPVKDKVITMRLADVGGDKVLPYLNSGYEYHSCLGLRGVRFLLRNRDFLTMLLRVLFQLKNDFNIRLVIPFVNTADDLKTVKKMMSDIKKELKISDEHPAYNIETGAMVETPAAAMQIRDILKVADFISIGTNDLIQYITAADRESIAVSHYYQNGIALSLKMIREVISEARKFSKQCFLCGELAGNTKYTEELLAMGLSDFSVLPPLIPTVKNKIYEVYHRTPELFKPGKTIRRNN